MSDKEDKIKIKVAIAKLKKKNALYKAYCKSNKIKIKGRVKEAIDSINLLCKLITKLAARKDFYQKLPEGFEGLAVMFKAPYQLKQIYSFAVKMLVLQKNLKQKS